MAETRLSDGRGRGITVTEMAAMGQPIEVSPETTAAFVGRALRGPLNQPVLVHNFGEFRRRFGDTWPRSSLGPAVRQFFEHGGRHLYVVRVANDARGPKLALSASGSALLLRACEPGTTERIRAAVDYDGIDAGDTDLFNLTLQRVDRATGHVIDQEIFEKASCREESDTFVADLLANSSLARVERPFPAHRPEPTAGGQLPHDAVYVQHAEEGTDGQELTDYDLVGSHRDETGLFALQQLDVFDLLYLPPPGKGRDLGLPSLLAAELFCRQRGAMLVVDPDTGWSTPAEAVTGVRGRGLASPNLIAYFPRMRRRTGVDEAPRAVGAAMAGLLCRLDRGPGCWQDLDHPGMEFAHDLVAACDVEAEDIRTLVREGINVIVRGKGRKAHIAGSVTMARGRESHGRFVSLSVRRLHLHIVNAIERGTRWAVFESDAENASEQVRGQVAACLSALADLGAFENDHFVVDCGRIPGRRPAEHEQGIAIRVGYHPLGSTYPIAFTLLQSVRGCRVTPTAFGRVNANCA